MPTTWEEVKRRDEELTAEENWGRENRVRCSACGRFLHPHSSSEPVGPGWRVRGEFEPAEDGDAPGEIIVDHYPVYRCQRMKVLHTVPEHRRGLLKRCDGAGMVVRERVLVYSQPTNQFIPARRASPISASSH